MSAIDALSVLPQDMHNVSLGKALAGSYLGDRSLLLVEWQENGAPISVSLQNKHSAINPNNAKLDGQIWLTWPIEAGVLLKS